MDGIMFHTRSQTFFTSEERLNKLGMMGWLFSSPCDKKWAIKQYCTAWSLTKRKVHESSYSTIVRVFKFLTNDDAWELKCLDARVFLMKHYWL